jgi:nitrite reductase (NADH) small subunit
MDFVKVGSILKLPPGSVMEVEVAGRKYAVCNSAGVVYALDGTCPHAGGPLGHGALHDCMLVCPWHAWEYDCRTGRNDFDPELKIDTFPVRLDGNDILIEVPH